MATVTEHTNEVDTTPLRRLRVRAMAAAAGERLVPGLAASLAVGLVVAGLDAALHPAPAIRLAGLAAALVPAIWGTFSFVRFVLGRDWSIEGAARLATARGAGSPNALSSWLEARRSSDLAPYVGERLTHAAAGEAAALDVRSLAPLARAGVALAFAAVLAAAWIAAIALGYDPVSRLGIGGDASLASGLPAAGDGAIPDGPDRVSVAIVPPSYTGLPASRLDDPVEVVAPAGARVEVTLVPGRADVRAGLSVNGAEHVAMQSAADGALVASFVPKEAGSVAVYPASDAGDRDPVLLPLRVVDDRPPDVRIVKPKADILIEPAVRPKTLVVEFEASDDYGLGALRLEYIRSVGEGDSAEFTRGELAVSIVGRRESASVGRCTIDLDKLGLTPGSALVYHIAAEDRNTVTGPSTGLSESLVFEIAAPKPPESITVDDLRPEDMQRFLMSQRMILENTLKLEAQREKTPREQFLARSTEIAGDQRDFKESFSQFIEIHSTDDHQHGGAAAGVSGFEQAREAVEDAPHPDSAADPVEEGREASEKAAEAEVTQHQHGAAELEGPVLGPVRELMLAVRAMWDAEGSLGIGETDKAIPSERVALEHLKRAQRAVRYHPRVAVKTKPIDLKRRYAGELADVRNRVERLAKRELAPDEVALRDTLGRLARALGASLAIDPDAGGAATADRADALSKEASETAAELLGAKTGYQPEVVAVAARLSAAAANARRLADAARGNDAPRSRSAWTATNDELSGAVSRLGALLDARPVARGAVDPAPGAGSRRQGSDYFRRLADGAR